MRLEHIGGGPPPASSTVLSPPTESPHGAFAAFLVPGSPAAARAGAPPAPGETPPAAPSAAALAADEAARVAEAQSQEDRAYEDRAGKDRRARQHGGVLLRALSSLQAARLGGTDTAARQALHDLTLDMPGASDPVLRLILREIALRAAVELARPGPWPGE